MADEPAIPQVDEDGFVNVTPETPETSVIEQPAELQQQAAEQKEAEERRKLKLRSRINSLTDKIKTVDGEEARLKEVIDGYIERGKFDFLKGLCADLGFDYISVKHAIQERDGNPNREGFSAILLDVEKSINRRRGIAVRELLYGIATEDEGEEKDQVHVKDRITAMKTWSAEVRFAATSQKQEDDDDTEIFPDEPVNINE